MTFAGFAPRVPIIVKVVSEHLEALPAVAELLGQERDVRGTRPRGA